jgi:hypothetical protein
VEGNLPVSADRHRQQTDTLLVRDELTLVLVMDVIGVEDELVVPVPPVAGLPPLPLSDFWMQPTKMLTPLMNNKCGETTIVCRLRPNTRNMPT